MFRAERRRGGKADWSYLVAPRLSYSVEELIPLGLLLASLLLVEQRPGSFPTDHDCGQGWVLAALLSPAHLSPSGEQGGEEAFISITAAFGVREAFHFPYLPAAKKSATVGAEKNVSRVRQLASSLAALLRKLDLAFGLACPRRGGGLWLPPSFWRLFDSDSRFTSSDSPDPGFPT